MSWKSRKNKYLYNEEKKGENKVLENHKYVINNIKWQMVFMCVYV